MEVERQRFGDAILVAVGGEIVMPLPGLAFEGGFYIDLDLLGIEPVAKKLKGGAEQARVASTGLMEEANMTFISEGTPGMM